jgi:hypothetical protein
MSSRTVLFVYTAKHTIVVLLGPTGDSGPGSSLEYHRLNRKTHVCVVGTNRGLVLPGQRQRSVSSQVSFFY